MKEDNEIKALSNYAKVIINEIQKYPIVIDILRKNNRKEVKEQTKGFTKKEGDLLVIGFVNFDIDVNNLSSAAIFINNKKILHSEFDINNYEEVTDFAFFDVMQNGIKQNYVTFIMLIVCTLGVVAGLILGFTLDKTINWIGWAVLAVSAVADVLIFVIFSKKRTKKLATLNKK